MKTSKSPAPHIPACVLLFCAFLAISSTHAATTYTFDPTVSGSQAWTTSANWGGTTPTSADQGIVDRSVVGVTGDLTFTNTSAVTVGKLSLTTTNSNAINFSLGADFSMTGNPQSAAESIWTTGTDASKLVIDLNGHNFHTDSTPATFYGLRILDVRSNPNMTIKSTGDAGGTFYTDMMQSSTAHLVLQNNVTLDITQHYTGYSGSVNSFNNTYSTGSTLQADTGSTNLYVKTSTGLNNSLGNLIIGSTTNATLANGTALRWLGNSNNAAGLNMQVLGNFRITAGSDLQLGYYYYGTRNVGVGGNFTDDGGGNFNTYNYAGGTGAGANGNATIMFNGGIGSEKNVSINRTLNSTDSGARTSSFQVGVDNIAGNASLTVDAGNIKLVNPSSTVGAIYTAGSFTVLANSRVNLGTATTTGSVASLRAGSITINSGATIAAILGANAGYGVADTSLGGSGVLTLNTFNLQLDYDGSGWIPGSSYVLFTYGTHAAGLTPTITNISTGYTITWGSLTDTGSQIVLGNVNIVAIPEPSTAFLLVSSFGGLLVWKLRRKV
ncbi:MAG: hypothetical protein ABI443_04890 [Chthoniobacterales bacterium]